MNAGKTNLWGIAALLLLVGTVLVLGAIALVRRDQREPIGGEIISDDFGFRVLSVETAKRVGAPGNEIEASGVFRLVRLQVTNHAQRVDYRLDSHRAVLVSAGRGYEADARAGEAWRARAGSVPAPEVISPGETALTELAFDLPAEARGLTLRISWGGPLVDVLEYIVFGDRHIVLE